MKRTFKRVPKKVLRNIKNASPTILTVTAAIGVVTTAIMAVKATPKALVLLEEAETDKGKELTTSEIVCVTAITYIPTAMVGLSTIACLFGANILNQKRQASLASAYALLNTAYKEYRRKVKELYGADGEADIYKGIVRDHYKKEKLSVDNEKELFWLENYGYFESTKEAVLLAEYHFNRNFTLRGYANLNEFYEFLGLGKTNFGELVGWSIDAGLEFYGYSWVDFDHEFVTIDDGLECCIISMPFSPTADYLGGWEA